MSSINYQTSGPLDFSIRLLQKLSLGLPSLLDDTQTNAVAAGIATFNADTAAILQASRIFPADLAFLAGRSSRL